MNDDSIHLKEIMNLRFEGNNKALELQAKIDETRFDTLSHRVESLQKLVYVGLGIVLAIQAILAYFV
jgi:hypothetical protein